MELSRVVAYVGLGLIFVAFITPWVSLPLFGELSLFQMLTLGYEESGEEISILEMWAREEPLVSAMFLLWCGAILIGLTGSGSSSPKIKKHSSTIFSLAGAFAILSGLIWVYLIQFVGGTSILRLNLVRVGVGTYITIIGGIVMVISQYFAGFKRENEVTR